MGNITTFEKLRQFIILSNNKSRIFKKEIIGMVFTNNKKLYDNIIYTLLFKDNKSEQCFISPNTKIDSPRNIIIKEFYVENLNGQNYLHIIKYEINESSDIKIENFECINYLNPIKIHSINEIKDINKEKLISIDLIYLKVKFIDVNKNSVNIINIDLFKKENPKFFGKYYLYNFKNVLYRNNNI